MKLSLIARVGRLERVEARVAETHLQVQIGYMKRLPADYQGDRHVVTVGQHAGEGGRTRYEFEERPGPAPVESAAENILRVCLVSVGEPR